MDGFTKNELFQTISRVENQEMNKDVLYAAIEEFNVKPEVQKNLKSNPFSRTSQEYIRQTFGIDKAREARIGLVLTETPSHYDEVFKTLSNENKRKALYEQIDENAYVLERLIDWTEKNADKIGEMSDEELFIQLKLNAYKTIDDNEIESKYSQLQRRSINLGLVNYVQDHNLIKKYKDQIQYDAKSELNYLFDKELEGELVVEYLPVGIIVYMDEKDFSQFFSDKNLYANRTNAFLVTSNDVPTELYNKVIIIKTGSEDVPIDKESILKSRAHEIRHLIGRNYTGHNLLKGYFEISPEFTGTQSMETHLKNLKRLTESSLELAKEELIAYNSKSWEFAPGMDALGEPEWIDYLSNIDKYVSQSKESDTNLEIQKKFYDEYANYLREVRQYRWIFDQLRATDTDEITRRHSEALAYCIPFTKSERIAYFLGIDIANFKTIYTEDLQGLTKDVSKVANLSLTFKKFVNSTDLDEREKRNLEFTNSVETSSLNDVYEQVLFYPVEAIPDYLSLISESNNYIYTELYLTALKYAVLSTETFSEDLHNQVNTAINKMLENKYEKFEKVNKQALEIKEYLDKVYKIRSS